jgi:hypothetical protein
VATCWAMDMSPLLDLACATSVLGSAAAPRT